MAGVRIVIDSNVPQITEKLAQLAAKLEPEHMRRVYGQIGAYLERSLDQRFTEQVDPSGRPWAGLSETTRAKKRQNKERILQEFGHLRDSFHYQIQPDGVLFGTHDVRAATHQFGARQGAFGRTHQGGPIPWGDIPAREMLGLSSEDAAKILAILAEHLAP